MVRVVLMSVALMVGIGKQNPDVRAEEDSAFGRTVCVSALRAEGIVFRSETQLPVASCFEVTSTYLHFSCVYLKTGKIWGCVWRQSNQNLVEGLVLGGSISTPLLGCLLAWTLVLAPCFFFSPFLECFLFYKVWQGFIKA
jgi:hypothetical protein